MAAVNTPRGHSDNVHLTHRKKCPLKNTLVPLEMFSSVEADRNQGIKRILLEGPGICTAPGNLHVVRRCS